MRWLMSASRIAMRRYKLGRYKTGRYKMGRDKIRMLERITLPGTWIERLTLSRQLRADIRARSPGEFEHSWIGRIYRFGKSGFMIMLSGRRENTTAFSNTSGRTLSGGRQMCSTQRTTHPESISRIAMRRYKAALQGLALSAGADRQRAGGVFDEDLADLRRGETGFHQHERHAIDHVVEAELSTVSEVVRFAGQIAGDQ